MCLCAGSTLGTVRAPRWPRGVCARRAPRWVRGRKAGLQVTSAVHTHGSRASAGAHTHGSRVAVGTRGAGAPLPLPPSSPPAAGRAPLAGLGNQSQEGRRGRAPSPLARPHPSGTFCRGGKRAAEGHLFGRRMRFWLRNEEMALEEMVQRLHAVCRHTGRRSCWPWVCVLEPDIMC